MRIGLPFIRKEFHAYLEEIMSHSDNQFIFSRLEDCVEMDIINIHWPEALYNWIEPNKDQLKQLQDYLTYLRETKKIVYTKHDYKRNKGESDNFKKLFKIVESHTDVFIHLGNYSKTIYEKRYPSAIHRVIPHPLLTKTHHAVEKEEARNQLGIDNESIVIIAPGKIRHSRERRLVLKAFNRVKEKNKVLISTNMRNELKFDFPGRVRMQPFFDVQQYVKTRFSAKHLPPKFIFSYSPISQKELNLKMAAADVVLVPRIDILNSGVVFLGASYSKVVVGPRTGNITEQLKEQNLPIFDPYSISSVTEALEKGIELYKRGHFHWQNTEKYQPEYVAKRYDKIFSDIAKDEA